MKGILERTFKLDLHQTSPKQEVLAGVTSFFTIVYIMIVNASILSDAGIPLEAGILATVFSSFVGCLLMAFWANAPAILVPGMGVNAFFTYTAVHTLGLTWQEALAAVFIAGIIFSIAAFTPIARVLSVSIPKSLKEAITVGIGLFLAFIGLQKGGLVVSHPNTAVAMGKLSSPVVLPRTYSYCRTCAICA